MGATTVPDMRRSCRAHGALLQGIQQPADRGGHAQFVQVAH